MNEDDFSYTKSGNLAILTCNAFSAYPFVRHGFTTRTGGVSAGGCASLNFSWKRKDTAENVKENCRRLAKAMNFQSDHIVFIEQTHSANVYYAGQRDRHDGAWWTKAPKGYDASVTNEAQTVLIARVADCMPVLLLDPVKGVISAVHSGWRSTAGKVILEAAAAMQREYGCNPQDLLGAIGPCIGPDCFCVGEEVADIFFNSFGSRKYQQCRDDKLYIDLWRCGEDQLKDAGLLKEHIYTAEICTHCEPERYFSHRRDRGETGAMLAVIELC